MPINICISGAAGRMGQRLIALALEDPELHLAYTVEHDGHPWIGKDIGIVSNLGKELGAPVARSICPNCGVSRRSLISRFTPRPQRALKRLRSWAFRSSSERRA